MQRTTQPAVYRITLSGRECRSAFSLLRLNVVELEHAVSAALIDDNTLIVISADGFDIHDALIAAVVDAGFDPSVVNVVELERIVDPTGLPLDQAIALGLIEPPKEPARAAVIQRVSVHVTDGYDPDTILLAADIPAEISFSEGHGCLGRVVFESLGVEADLEHGGAVVELPPLHAGTYPFRCGRDMVHGTLIVE